MRGKIIKIKDESFKLVQEENADDILDEQNLENPIESCKSTFRDKTFQKLLTENVHGRVKLVKVKLNNQRF